MRIALATIIGIALVVAALIAFWPERSFPPPSPRPRLVWVFEAPKPGSIIAAPCATPDAIYIAAAHFRGPRMSGAVYALDPSTGKPKWVFDRDGAMLPTASTPLVGTGRLFVGEGMHGHFACRLQCLDSANGQARWEFATSDHIEGGASEADGVVFFPAGNDGLYAVDAETGLRKWNFRADLHIDSTPCAIGGQVFVGSGKSRRFDTFQVVCLDASSGNPVWRTPVPLPAWGAPIIDGDRIYVGLGNGRLTESVHAPETPAGALVCLDATTGKIRWSIPAGDAVFGRPAVAADRVVFGSRDGNVYGVSLDGREVFRFPMGAPVVAGLSSSDGLVYAVSVAGRIVCLDHVTGQEIWRHELGRPGVEPRVFAAPVIAGKRLFVAAEMAMGENGIVSLFCFDLPTQEGSGP